MKVIIISISSCLIHLCSCINTSTQEYGIVFNKKLWDAYQNFNNELLMERQKISFSQGLLANNCLTYLELIAKYKIEESFQSKSLMSEYLICEALNILSNNNIRFCEKTDSINFGETLSSKLDLRSFSSSLFNMCDNEQYFLNILYPESTSSSGTITVADVEDWYYSFEVVSKLKINNNETLDWVVWFCDEAKSGNYRAYNTLIIYDPIDKEIIYASSYP